MRKYLLGGVVAALCLPLASTTLQQLTLNDIARKSTSIVRGRLQPSYTALRGSIIYTHYTIQVEDSWKGIPGNTIDVAVPGGTVNGIRQTYSGAPALSNTQDYIIFLWTSPSGLTQIIGLSQGLFNVNTNASGVQIVTRAASQENMLNAAGQQINDTNFSMSLPVFKVAVANAMTSGGVAQ